MVQDRAVNVQRWFYFLLICQVVLWTVFPTLVRYTLPVDAMEGTTWGHIFQWGYDRNPFMNALLTHWADVLGGRSGWLIYACSQISIGVCFWAVWRLGREFLCDVHALMGVALLMTLQFFTIAAVDFNDNVLELSLWALLSLSFYQAVKTQKTSHWLLVGVWAGLAMMTKYYLAVLLAPMLLFLCWSPQQRLSFKKPGMYLGLLVFSLICLPHVLWLPHHDYITLQYAFNRVARPGPWWVHVTRPLEFGGLLLANFLIPVLVALAWRWGRSETRVLSDAPRLTAFDKQFLWFVGIGPLLTTMLLSAVKGMHLSLMWGQPLMSLWGLMYVAWRNPKVTVKSFHRFIFVLMLFLAAVFTAYTMSKVRAGAGSSANFPGKEIAASISQQWQQRYHQPLRYVAGSRWIAGNIAFFSQDKPAVYIRWNPRVSTWIDEAQFRQHGAVFVWDRNEDYQDLPAEVKARFPRLDIVPPQQFPWHRAKNKFVDVGVAFLPPEVKTKRS